MAEDNDISSYAKLRKELWRRTIDPFSQPPFVFYVVTGVVLFGGLGVWVELVKLCLSDMRGDSEALVTAVITFFSTLAGAATIQLNYSSYEKSDKDLGSFALLLMCLFACAGVLLAFFGHAYPASVLFFGVICSLAATWVWWITNGDEPTFRATKKDVDAAVGGDPERDLPGNLDGFEA